MKVCKIIKINDGNERLIRDRGRLCVEEISSTQMIINEFLKNGFEVKHMCSAYRPNISRPGDFSFFIDGFNIYFEKEVDDMDAYRELERELEEFIENLLTEFDKNHPEFNDNFEYTEDYFEIPDEDALVDYCLDEDDDESI